MSRQFDGYKKGLKRNLTYNKCKQNYVIGKNEERGL